MERVFGAISSFFPWFFQLLEREDALREREACLDKLKEVGNLRMLIALGAI